MNTLPQGGCAAHITMNNAHRLNADDDGLVDDYGNGCRLDAAG
jgi:hypothetical protein